MNSMKRVLSSTGMGEPSESSQPATKRQRFSEAMPEDADDEQDSDEDQGSDETQDDRSANEQALDDSTDGDESLSGEEDSFDEEEPSGEEPHFSVGKTLTTMRVASRSRTLPLSTHRWRYVPAPKDNAAT